MLICAILAGGAMMTLEQTVLGKSNRKAEAIKHIMRGGSPETFDVLNRRWVMGTDGTIYHYDYFNPRWGEFSGLWTYKFSDDLTRVRERTFAAKASYESAATWRAANGWSRAFDKNGETTAVDFKPFTESHR